MASNLRSVVGGTVARRNAMDLQLRDLARQLLALDPGDVAHSDLSFIDLEVTVDYLTSAVQAGRADQ